MSPLIGCKWCGKKLAARYERRCKDCEHSMYWHRFHASSDQKNCSAANCSCSALQPISKIGERTSEQFPRKRVGFGLDARNLFCTQACAICWAHKHAAGAR